MLSHPLKTLLLLLLLTNGSAGFAVAHAADTATADTATAAAVNDAVVEAASDAAGGAEATAAPQAAAAQPGTAIVPGSELQSMTGPLLRMVLSLALVLGLVGAFAWLAKRFRGGQLQGGLIQIVSGLSLGPKERVVLLRVGDEEVLVGLSPAGMSRLHVMGKGSGQARFSLGLAEQDAGMTVRQGQQG